MKKYSLLILLLAATTISFSQQKDKIKGSKVVMIIGREIANFEAIDVVDNIEVSLEKGEKCGLKIEADENLHDIIKTEVVENMLKISTTKPTTSFKKLAVRITYTNLLKKIVAKNKSVVNAIQELQLDNVDLQSFGNSKLFLNANTKNFSLKSNDESKVELNLKSENVSFEISQNAQLKALVTAINLKSDLYQKANANLEGDIENAAIRLDNDSKLSAKNLTIINANLLVESESKASVNATTTIGIEATGKAEIELYGNAKIDLKRFENTAVLMKKLIK